MIRTAIDATLVQGVAELEGTRRGVRPHRLPGWVRDQFPDPQLLMAEAQPSGARLTFRTPARTIELVSHPSRVSYRGLDRPRGCIDLVVDGILTATRELEDGDFVEVDIPTGTREFHSGPSHTATFDDLPLRDKLVDIWLPHNEALELIELRTDEPIAAVVPSRPRWVHHGSSISQGSNATTPTRIWPVVAAQHGGVDLYNLGLGGSALVDGFTARVIRDSSADMISVKLGINVANFDAMRLRAFVPAVHAFLDTVREGHPRTPLVLISPLFCAIQEDTPGPVTMAFETSGADGVRFAATGDQEGQGSERLTLRVIREAMASLAQRRSQDANLHYLNGTDLYGPDDAITHPLPDALHPDGETHRLIGQRFANYAFTPGGPFGAIE